MHRCIYYFGLWEPPFTHWILDTLQPGDTFVDVGANIGYFSLLAARRVGRRGHVVAIEPSPTTFARLQANIAANRLSNVRAVQAAAAQAQPAIPFYRASNDAESSTVPIPGFTYETDVPAAPLAQLLSDEELARTRLVKIDVEGAEMDVVAGLVPALPHMRPDVEVAIEVHPHLMAVAGSSPQELRELFESLGFRPYYLPVDFSTIAHLDPPLSRPIRLTEPRDEMVHLIFSRRRSAEL